MIIWMSGDNFRWVNKKSYSTVVVNALEQVRRRSAAERAGVKVGDVVLAINDITTSNLKHQQMNDLISRQQLALQLTLYRYVAGL